MSEKKPNFEASQVIENLIQEAKAIGEIDKAVSGIIINYNNSILLVKRVEEDFMGGYWELPGGGVDEGETFEIGCKREAMEELGIDIQIDEFVDTFDYISGSGKKARQYNIISNFSEKPLIELNDAEHSSYIFASLKAIPQINSTIKISESTHKSLINAAKAIESN